ncbi:uncharacterized protein LOC123905179 [Trifolium pratense]|uniref:uncharacterized protein LOC123905179 n=1 Tax=Trifolium pratense TaxID=57577 RepID=UPI001E6960F2|nr:uncharacterized protein LOC123905179 [Trifolium pratense]
MRRTGPSELQFDPEIEKTTRANRKAAREALLASRHKATSSGAQNCQEQNFSDMEDEQEPLVHEQPPPPLRRTLGDYGRRDNDALANQGRAKDWLDTIPAGTIETWRQLERKFLDRYFPIHKFLERRAEISNFEQADGETLYDAWESWWIIENRDETEARELVESMAQNEYRATNDRGAKKRGGMLELDTQTALLAQQKLMTSQMEAMMKFQTQASLVGKVENVICDFCLQDHPNGGCFPEGSEEARYLANFRKSYPNNNNGSGWGNMQGQGSAQQRPPSRMEETLNQFMMMTQSNFEAMKSSQETSNKNHEASIKNLEVQMGQLSRQFSMLQNNGGFGGNTLDNPTNESCNGITLRSREILERDEGEVENEKLSREVEVSDDEEVEVEKQRELRKKEKKKSEKGKGVDESPYARVPYPRKKRVKNQDCEKDFKKFMKVLNKLEMAIPLVEALEQMPSYAKFLKELLTKKRKPLDDEMVSMTEECSALIQRKLPQKKKDLGSFTIPCSIGNLTIGKALCDLGASINLMSLSMMKKIPGAVANPTKMSLSLADRSIVNPEGILHDVLVRVAGFVLPADFVVLDIEETSDWKPLLLGRPFLATSRALIDVELGELMQRTEDHQIVFNVFKTMKCYDGDPQCFQVQVYDEMIKEALKLPWKETHLPQGGTLLHNP